MSSSNSSSSSNPLNSVYETIFEASRKISHILRKSINGGLSMSKANTFGDIQLESDVACDKIIFSELENSKYIARAHSEENIEGRIYEGKDYIVTFDPLDGSSIVGANWMVGSIFGIWKYSPEGLVGKTGRELVGAAISCYGPRITVIFYDEATKSVKEHTLIDEKWVPTKENIIIKPATKIFAPGNLRAVNEDKAYMEMVNYWIKGGYTLRYSGGVLSDVNHIFCKGEGIFSTLVTRSFPAKLRYLYETAPISFLIESAGGKSSDGSKSILDTKIESLDQRSCLCCGSVNEITRIEEYVLKFKD